MGTEPVVQERRIAATKIAVAAQRVEDELGVHVGIVTDIDGGLGELDLGHSLQNEPGDLVGEVLALFVDATEGDVREERAWRSTLFARDRDEVFTLGGS